MEIYPTPEGAQRCVRYAVAAEGAAVFVERWREVSYARFAIEGPVAIEIAVAAEVSGVEVMPASAIEELRVGGGRIGFRLRRPANLAVLVSGASGPLERLFVLVDACEPVPAVDGVRVVGYEAVPAGLATAGLQQAIDGVAARGGGTLVVPAGTFVTGTLRVRSGVTVYLAPGAVLRGSEDPADYPVDDGRIESGSDPSIARADERYRGETMTFSRLILFDDAEDAAVVGRGTIDGSGTYLRQVRNAVPNLIRVRGGQRIAIRDVLLRDAAAWTVHLLGARHVDVTGVKIVNHRGTLNTDGIDPDSCQDVVVRGCLIYTKDDAVCVKATNNSDRLQDVERIEVTGNVVSSLDAGLKVGTESQAARFADIVFRDNDVFDAGRALSVVVRDGARYERLAFRDLRVGPGVRHLIEQVIGVRDGRAPTLGQIDGLVLEDVVAPGFTPPDSHRTWYTQFRPGDAGEREVPVFAGADHAHAVRGLVLRRVVVGGERVSDRETAARAGLTIGPHVDDVAIE